MKSFMHIDATSIDEAFSWLRRYGLKANLIAGGTDLLGKLKDEILPRYPEAIINIKTIPGLNFIQEEDGAERLPLLLLIKLDCTCEKLLYHLFCYSKSFWTKVIGDFCPLSPSFRVRLSCRVVGGNAKLNFWIGWIFGKKDNFL